MNYGIGQGTILGPLVFLIIINDIYSVSKYCTVIGFADDTTLYHVYHNLVTLHARVKHDFRVLIDWFRANKLSLNMKKTHCMLFSNKRDVDLTSINVEGNEITRVPCFKLLGVWIDDKLSWTQHLEKLTNKLKSGIHALKMTKNLLPVYVKKRLYYAFIDSHLNYCIDSWGSMLTDSKLNVLQKLQNNCIRIICKLKPTERVTSHLKKLRILNIRDKIKLAIGRFMYKHENNLLPSGLCNLFKKPTHNYGTRSKTNTCYVNIKDGLLKKGPNVWNSLPTEHRQKSSFKCFSNSLKNWLIDAM